MRWRETVLIIAAMRVDQALRIVAVDRIGRGGFRRSGLPMAVFVTILLLSNVVGAGNRAVVVLPLLGAWPLARVLFFRCPTRSTTG